MGIGGSRFERAVLLGIIWVVQILMATYDEIKSEGPHHKLMFNLERLPTFIYLAWQFIKIAVIERA